MKKELKNARNILFQILPHYIVYHLHIEPLLIVTQMSSVEIPNTVQKALRDEKNAFLFDDLEEEVYIRRST